MSLSAEDRDVILGEIKESVIGINRRLDISNGRLAKLENRSELDGKEHYVFQNQISLLQQSLGTEVKKTDGWGELMRELIKFILFGVVGAVLALVIKQ